MGVQNLNNLELTLTPPEIFMQQQTRQFAEGGPEIAEASGEKTGKTLWI